MHCCSAGYEAFVRNHRNGSCAFSATAAGLLDTTLPLAASNGSGWHECLPVHGGFQPGARIKNTLCALSAGAHVAAEVHEGGFQAAPCPAGAQPLPRLRRAVYAELRGR